MILRELLLVMIFISAFVDFVIVEKRRLSLIYERANGIEPSSLDWKSKVITIIRRPQAFNLNTFYHNIKKNQVIIS